MILKTSLVTLPILLALRVNPPLIKDVPPPVEQGMITSEFGLRVHPLLKVLKQHSGVDIKAAKDSKALSVGSGIVIFAGNYKGYGNLVVIRHANNISTHYAHLESFNLRVGEVVAQGTEIGTIGNTGNSNAPHLHFEVRKSGNPIDPKRVIPSLSNLTWGDS